jgi:hypothetical protein
MRASLEMSARCLLGIGRFAFKVVMAQATGNTQKKQFRVDRNDSLFVLGLTAFTVGVALALSWPWALVASGLILMSISILSASRSA